MYTIESLTAEVNETYKTDTLQDFKDRSDYRGITQRSQYDFNKLFPMYVRKISNLVDNPHYPEVEREEGLTDQEYLQTVLAEVTKDLVTNADKIERMKDKFFACLKEVQMRKDGDVIRTGLHRQTNYYMAFTPSNAGTLTGTWTFTNGSNSVTAASDGDAANELDAGDYVRQSDGTAWYEVSATPDADTITLATNFQQATHTDDVGASKNADVSAMVGTSIANAYVSMRQYTTTQVRTAGDNLFVRANETHGTNGVDIIFDEDGDHDNYISIIGCDSVTNDPFSDASDVLPIFDFEDANYQANFSGDLFWYLERIVFKQGGDSAGIVNVGASSLYMKTCTIQDCNTTSVEGLRISGGFVVLDTCTFENCNGTAIQIIGGRINIDNCTFTPGGDVSTDRGIWAFGGTAYVKDTTFAATMDVTDMLASSGGVIYSRNCTFNKTPTVSEFGKIYSEDDDGTFEAQQIYYMNGTVTRSTAVNRSGAGGADSSAAVLPGPAGNVGVNNPMTIADEFLKGDFQCWVPASETTITVYIRAYDAWGTYPTNTELYIEASYLSAAPTRSWSTKSVQVLSDGVTWVAFTTTFTPNAAGWAYVRVVLNIPGTYVDGIYVDIKPVVS